MSNSEKIAAIWKSLENIEKSWVDAKAEKKFSSNSGETPSNRNGSILPIKKTVKALPESIKIKKVFIAKDD